MFEAFLVQHDIKKSSEVLLIHNIDKRVVFYVKLEV